MTYALHRHSHPHRRAGYRDTASFNPLPAGHAFRAVTCSLPRQERFFASRHQAALWLQAQGGGELFQLSSVPLAFPIDTVLLQTVQEKIL